MGFYLHDAWNEGKQWIGGDRKVNHISYACFALLDPESLNFSPEFDVRTKGGRRRKRRRGGNDEWCASPLWFYNQSGSQVSSPRLQKLRS